MTSESSSWWKKVKKRFLISGSFREPWPSCSLDGSLHTTEAKCAGRWWPCKMHESRVWRVHERCRAGTREPWMRELKRNFPYKGDSLCQPPSFFLLLPFLLLSLLPYSILPLITFYFPSHRGTWISSPPSILPSLPFTYNTNPQASV